MIHNTKQVASVASGLVIRLYGKTLDLQTHELPTDQETLGTLIHLDALSRERGTKKDAFLSRIIEH